ncbi:MAG TPA: leucine--tRNA ligase, partial [Treponemataceae bacterium]|nr:leucine--tRNA ligase [Treponemataceae bacterium]
YTATDIYCRYLRMNGYNVLHPMGFDSFGLPAENYAIKTGTHPSITTEKNIENFTRQIKAFGFSYDWDRCIRTSDASYYRWTQWIFLQLFKKGLAYESKTPINWCPSCLTGLANEEVKDGHCERCGTKVTRRTIRQWVLKITDYAEKLLTGIDSLDWPDSIKAMQKNWIGKSTGAEVDFTITDSNGKATNNTITVYTTRPDTLFGATYMVMAPEHPLVSKITTAKQKDAVKAYINASIAKSDLERTDLAKEKTGVFSGGYAINPVNGQKIPIWLSDYVLISYGTGAIMAVPAHDERDWDFAKTFDLPIIKVVASEKEIALLGDGNTKKGASLLYDAAKNTDEYKKLVKAYPAVFNIAAECSSADGYSINSKAFTGLKTQKTISSIIEWLSEKRIGKKATNYKLRDWIFSRQRYWGEPIPLVHCEKCGCIPIPENELPLELPKVTTYQPTGTGESPLASIEEWVNCTCPICAQPAKRETNTMPQWAGSCWYYLRYLDPTNTEEFVAKDKIEYWMPVDLYVGGAEHAVLHLLYARFWHHVLFDLEIVNTREPFQRLINQGLITSFSYQRPNKVLVPTDMVIEKDGRYFDKETNEELQQVVAKMSKSLKNVVNPDDVIKEYGADSIRLYEMFMGPLEVSKPWNTNGIIGVHRFLEKAWAISEKPIKDLEVAGETRKILHKTIKKVTEDTSTLNFNTAISQMMVFLNEISKLKIIPLLLWKDFVKMLSVYAPHLGEELWEKLTTEKSTKVPGTIAYEQWPEYNEEYCKDTEKTIVVQVNGKIRGKFETETNTAKDILEKRALSVEGAKKYIEGKTIVKVIVVPDKLVNIVVK